MIKIEENCPLSPNKYSKQVLWLFIVILSFLTENLTIVYGQSVNPQPLSRQFTVDEGLPSNEVYHVIQDSMGYIWIATANGVSRFDGKSFTNWGIEDGILENNIYELYIDYKGRIWFISGSGKLTYFQEGQIHSFPYNNKIKDNVPSSRGTLKNSFYVDSSESVHLSLKLFGRVEISSEGIFKKLDGIHQEADIVVEKLKNGPILISNPLNPETFDIAFLDDHYPFRYKAEEVFRTLQIHFHFFFFQESIDTYIMAARGEIFRIRKGEIIQRRKISQDIIWASLDKEGNLWVAPLNGGIFCFKNGDFSKEPLVMLFKDIKITSVVQDRENGYWFSSLTQGVFYCPNINILTLDASSKLPSNRVNVVYANREGVFLGYEVGVVSKISNNFIKNFTVVKDFYAGSPIRFLGIDSTSSKVWICSSNFVHSLENNKVTEHHILTSTGSYPRQIIKAREGGYWIASSWGLKKFDGEKFVYDSRQNDVFSGIIYSLYQDPTNALWLCCVNGLWKFEHNVFNYLGDQNVYFSYPSNHIKGTADGKILFGTKGVGLIVLNGDSIRQITQSDGIAGNSINKIVIDESGIWLATNKGISWIKSINNRKLDIQNINTSHGLPTNDINDIFIRDSHVYVASSKGLSFFHIDIVKPNLVKPRCIISDVRVNNTEVSIQQNILNLSYTQNFLAIDFVGLAFKNMGKELYRYRMLGMDSIWVHTKSNSSVFSRIPHGRYTFEVQSQNSDGLWSDSAQLKIAISPPFWQTYWFIIGSTFLFSGLIFMVYRMRIDSIKRRNDLINNANIYKQQSLRQQMNPHFIFNTLNSIQLYILEKDSISSHKYLTKFARLMRITLDNSQQSTIPLKDELEALKLYLELESLRLEGKFQYFIEIENDEVLTQKVPTLLIQPFVENAIWHGIMLKDEQEGFVRVNIRSNNQTIICTIEDNGIGRKKAQLLREKKNTEHKSLGFKITAQRIELLNTLYKEKFNIQYFDLSDSKGNPTGTKVQIQIPYTIQDNELKS